MMGGNALTQVQTHRLARKEYFVLRDRVLGVLQSSFKDGRRIIDIPAYRTKDSFGDLDVLIESFPGDSVRYIDLLTELFHPRQIVPNSGIYSFDVENFQVDLILTPSDDFDTSLAYFSWNDLGNLTGRIFKKLGFKYGHKGLSFMFRENDKSHSVYASPVISRNMKQILEFGDLDYTRFEQGFDTVDEMFRWVSSSKYFHKDIYLLHNRNNTSRTRDKKRKIYNEFLKWCEVTPGLPEYPWTEMREQDGYAGKPEFVAMAFGAFEGFADIYAEIVLKHQLNLQVKEKFNGSVVSHLTGFTGKTLGEFMQNLINGNGGRDVLQPFLLSASTSDIERFVMLEKDKFLLPV